MMNLPLHRLLRGPFNFLRADDEEIRRLFPDPGRALPQPQQIFLEEESATPLRGFPILITPGLLALSQALNDCLIAEEEAQVAVCKRQAFDRRAHGAAWDRFRVLLSRAIENVTVSSFGRHHPAIFWLHQSLDASRLLKDTPRRVARIDVQVARDQGEEIKYRVLDKYLDCALTLTYDWVNGQAAETDEVEDELFPPLLTRMRDNVLLLSETYVGPDLGELAAYFKGHMRLDGRDLLERRAALLAWHEVQMQQDPELRGIATHLLGADPAAPAAELLQRPGYLTFLAARPTYKGPRLPDPQQVQILENLLVRLKEFELLHALRKLIVPVEKQGEVFICRDRRGLRGGVMQPLHLSSATRPLDFMAPWVVDPQVSRCGMIYDISNFSEILSILRWSGNEAQEDSFRMILRFQRRVNSFAQSHRLRLEKYLGDGAFYSARETRLALITAIRTQRYYKRILTEGFPFDRGLRIALNFGQYRLFPLQDTQAGGAERYEFFGHGLVELSRLVSGKALREVEEMKVLLIGRGYPEAAVNRFFAPLVGENADVVIKREESRQFYAYLNPNGTLINEGIIATEPFMQQLSAQGGLGATHRTDQDGRAYVLLTLPELSGEVAVGIRKLGFASLKGLDRVAVYEVIDADGLQPEQALPLPENGLVSLLDQESTHSIEGRNTAASGG